MSNILLKAIVVDDEMPAIDVLINHAEKIPFLSIEKYFLSPKEAYGYLESHDVDILFLDIQMGEISGLDLASLIRNLTTSIVFTTAYSEYAVRGFELGVVDYLLKPITFDRFLTAVERVNKARAKLEERPFIFVKDGYNLVKVELSSLAYLQSDGNLLFFITDTGKVVTRMKISEALDLLPDESFQRVHKSYIINLNKVSRWDGQYLLIGEQKIPVSMTYREQLLSYLNRYLGHLG